ncbi:MAG TPA: alpha/beta hydrolase [Bacteroidales bacterium]|nr:MAG: hypothetical protein A2W98_09225 [Bacteroidetes bacterium GWF2_33_38]OFY84810.1 MAG: hypothetical protein A2236_13465 [Bacteroidetes bacterium RIFOXYA2_FULL_33_7]HBF87797.1 alpha/beta hydrolase [Bacteroidales bacterium]
MKLNFKKYGEGEPLVILHGLYGSSDNWVTIARRFDFQFSVYLIDQRNHGHSPHSSVHNYGEMLEDLLEFMNEHNLTKSTILGHSMGGKTAMYFAQKYPERVKTLIVADISPFAYKMEFANNHEFIISNLLSLNLKSFSTRNEIDIKLSESIKQKSLRNFLLKNISRADDNSFEWLLNLKAIKNNIHNILNGFDREINPIIEFPVLFIKGENSPYISGNDLQDILKIFPNADFKTISKAGHWLHAEQPEIFSTIVLNFLNKTK